VNQSVNVAEEALAVNPEQMTPTVIISRQEIQTNAGCRPIEQFQYDHGSCPRRLDDARSASRPRRSSVHVGNRRRSNTQTNIASNVGPQIDPKDIDYIEAQRGGYSAAYGDRSYGVFDVVPRTGFERDKERELYTSFGTFTQINDQMNFGSHSEKFAYFASVNGNRSNYGLATPGPDVLHDRVWGLGGMASFIYNSDANNQFRFISSLRRDDYQIPDDPGAETAGIRDVERERDVLGGFSWAHTF
jgi:hypothetical protein